MNYSRQWDKVYLKGQQIVSWPWSEVVTSLCKIKGHKENKIILELGCGTGPNIAIVRSLSYKYIGVDGSQTAIDSIDFKYSKDSNVNALCADFTSRNFWDNLKEPVDIILDRSALTHNTTNNIKNVLDFSFKALVNKGIFLGFDWFSKQHSDINYAKSKLDDHTFSDFTQGQFKDVGSVHFSDEAHIKELFTNYKINSLSHKINTYHINPNIDLAGNRFAAWNIQAEKKITP